MPEPITLSTNAGEYALALTMKRVQLITDLTGIDLLAGQTDGLSEPRNVLKVLYAMAGGEEGTSLSLDDFSDNMTLSEFAAAATAINAVLARDANTSSGKAVKGAGGAKNA